MSLLETLPFPLAAPSANPFTYVSPTRPQHVVDQLGDKVQYVLDGGPCDVGIESTILSFRNGHIQVLRKGGISLDHLMSLTNHPIGDPKKEEKGAIPGNFKKHYSNGRKLIFNSALETIQLKEGEFRLFFSKPNLPGTKDFWLTEDNDIALAARNVFQRLRELDHPKVQTIYVERAPDFGLGPAINDRLTRASESG